MACTKVPDPTGAPQAWLLQLGSLSPDMFPSQPAGYPAVISNGEKGKLEGDPVTLLDGRKLGVLLGSRIDRKSVV